VFKQEEFEMKTTMVISALAAGVLAGPVLGDVVAVGEFAGEAYETFENVIFPGSVPGPAPIFGGDVTVNDSLANILVVAFNWNGPSGTVLPYNGNLMGGVPAGAAVFDFSTAVTRFGGYFNTVGPVGGGTAVFYDADGMQIGSTTFGGTPAEWAWLGWESDVGIGRVEITGPVQGFGFQFDDLTLNYVPMPGTAAVLAAGACVLGRRRRA
jgi:hypothetical protein